MADIHDRWPVEWKGWGYRFTYRRNPQWRIEGDGDRWQVLYNSAATSDERFTDSVKARLHAEKLIQAREDIKALRLDRVAPLCLTRTTNRRTR